MTKTKATKVIQVKLCILKSDRTWRTLIREYTEEALRECLLYKGNGKSIMRIARKVALEVGRSESDIGLAFIQSVHRVKIQTVTP